MTGHPRFGFRLPTIASAVFLILLLPLLGLAACSSSAKTTPKATATPHVATRGFKFVLVADGPASDPFWALAKKGADQAATDMGVSVTYQAPDASGGADMGTLIDNAVATQPDGLVISIPNCDQLATHIQQALLVGIPVISIHSGSACAAKLGLLNYIGQTDYQAGYAGGQQMAAAGAKHVLCVNQAVGDPDMNSRCSGVHDAMKKAGGKTDVLSVDLSNPASVQQKLQALLTQDPSIDGVITLNAAGASVAITAAQGVIRAHQIVLATFDVSAAVLQAIQAGHMQFAIDQQPYLQGYLSVALLALYKENLSSVASPTVSTGPIFVTSANVAQIAQLEGAGLR